MFSRLGGCSPVPFASLNLSFGVGDQAENVLRNRQLVLRALGCGQLLSLGQVHGERILVVQERPQEKEYHGYDAVITDLPDLALLIQQADCQAVLLHDPVRQAIAAIHCGWRGSVAGIIGKTIARLQTEYAVDPASLRALISPSLGPCCAEFIHYRKELPQWMHAYETANKTAHFDFWAISRKQLGDAGVPAGQIETTGICTRCCRDYFSFRRAKKESAGLCGRNGSAIALALDVQRISKSHTRGE